MAKRFWPGMLSRFLFLNSYGCKKKRHLPLNWRHNDHDGVSNPQPNGCLLNRLFRRRSKLKAPRHWPLCGEIIGTGEFPAQRASYAENVSVWWRHHVRMTKSSYADQITDVTRIQNFKIKDRFFSFLFSYRLRVNAVFHVWKVTPKLPFHWKIDTLLYLFSCVTNNPYSKRNCPIKAHWRHSSPWSRKQSSVTLVTIAFVFNWQPSVCGLVTIVVGQRWQTFSAQWGYFVHTFARTLGINAGALYANA